MTGLTWRSVHSRTRTRARLSSTPLAEILLHPLAQSPMLIITRRERPPITDILSVSARSPSHPFAGTYIDNLPIRATLGIAELTSASHCLIPYRPVTLAPVGQVVRRRIYQVVPCAASVPWQTWVRRTLALRQPVLARRRALVRHAGESAQRAAAV